MMPHDEPGGRLVQFPLSPSYETIYRAPDGRLCMLVFSGETGSFEAVRADGKVQVGYLDNDTPARFDEHRTHVARPG